MSNTHHVAGSYCRQNSPKEKDTENFTTRVKTVTGTQPQSRSRLVESPGLDSKPEGTIYRSSVDQITPLPADHVFTSVHRPEPADIQSLKRHQTDMLTDRARRKRKTK